ncbi:MAG: deoxyribonuclease IV [Candidatus Moraniibacteriota bacterium]
MNIGCHISIAGGIFEAPKRAHDLGCECFQIFSRSPQGGKAPELTPEVIEKFKEEIKKYSLENFYIHTPYYINFASENNRIRYGSVSVVRDELERGNFLGAKYVMTHLGTAKDLGQKEAVKKTIEMLQKTLEGYRGETKLILENSAGAGEIIGDNLSELAEIIKGVKSPFIAGICLDTQHSFASGYDWRDFNVRTGRDLSLLEKIDQEIGLENIKLIHANDSLTECNSKKDRHAHIGEGLIGSDAFKNIVAFAQKNEIDMILETQHDRVADDIKLLRSFRLK